MEYDSASGTADVSRAEPKDELTAAVAARAARERDPVRLEFVVVLARLDQVASYIR